MVIGLLAVTAIPTVIGVGQAVSAQKKQNAASKEQEKFNIVPVLANGRDMGNAAICVLVDKKAWLDLPEYPVQGHKFCGYHFRYPSEEQHLGMVSTISDDPPMLNWLYINAETRELAYGGRKDTIGHVIGPWGWTSDERFVTLRGSPEGFLLVKKEVQKPQQPEQEQKAPEHKREDGEVRKVDEQDEEEEEDVDEEEEDEDDTTTRWAIEWDPDGQRAKQLGSGQCFSVLLRRKPLMGMESRYVRD